MKNYLAIYIGASSGRHILGSIRNGKLVLEEIHRFDNVPITLNNNLYWDCQKLFAEIIKGLEKCKKLNKIPVSLGIDTWGVDYALLGKDDEILGGIYCYRDNRTANIVDRVHSVINKQKLYEKTGIQPQNFNTIYQLYHDKINGKLKHAHSMLMMPDYLSFLLTGNKLQEYTNATTTGLVNCESGEWDKEIIKTLGFPQKLFKKLSPPKTSAGRLKKDIADRLGFDLEVILPCSHDTASAVFSVPDKTQNSLYISSGTWSLIGTQLDDAILTEKARLAGYTNEGGFAGKIRFLKNISGLWIINECMRNWQARGEGISFKELDILTEKAESNKCVIDVNSGEFFQPLNMPEKIQNYCRKTKQYIPQTKGEIARCIYESLAISYRDAIKDLESITDKTIDAIHIVGGGSKNYLLNQFTNEQTGKKIVTGPVEATATGNLLVQLMASGEIKDRSQAVDMIINSMDIKEIK